MAVCQRLRYMFFMGVQETETISFVFSLCFSYMVYFAKKKKQKRQKKKHPTQHDYFSTFYKR